MQAQKQIHSSQLWQQGLNDVISRSCDTIVLKTLPLVVQRKLFRWWVRKHETISTKKFAFLIVTLWLEKTRILAVLWPSSSWFLSNHLSALPSLFPTRTKNFSYIPILDKLFDGGSVVETVTPTSLKSVPDKVETWSFLIDMELQFKFPKYMLHVLGVCIFPKKPSENFKNCFKNTVSWVRKNI